VGVQVLKMKMLTAIKDKLGMKAGLKPEGNLKRNLKRVNMGSAPIISIVFIILITIVSITLVLYVAIPAINRAKEAAVLNEAMQNMRVLDNLIREVASEGVGSLRSMQLKVSGGTYTVNKDANAVDFDFDMTSGLIQPGTFVKDGNLLIMAGVNAEAKEQDFDGDGNTDLVLENEIMRVVLKKVGTASSWAAINTKEMVKMLNMKSSAANITIADSSVLMDGYLETSYGTGYSELVKSGDHLARAEARVHVNASIVEYDVIYSLQSGADFVLVKTENAYYK